MARAAALARPYVHPVHPILVTVPIGDWTASWRISSTSLAGALTAALVGTHRHKENFDLPWLDPAACAALLTATTRSSRPRWLAESRCRPPSAWPAWLLCVVVHRPTHGHGGSGSGSLSSPERSCAEPRPATGVPGQRRLLRVRQVHRLRPPARTPRASLEGMCPVRAH